MQKTIIGIIIALVVLIGGYYVYQQFAQQGTPGEQVEQASGSDLTEYSLYFTNDALVTAPESLVIPDEVRQRFEDNLVTYVELQSDENNAYQGYMGEANTYLALGDYATSLEKLLAMTERYPEDELVFQNLGELYTRMQQYELAAESYERAIKNRPDEVQPYLKYARLYQDYSSDPTKAEPIYQAAMVGTEGATDVVTSYADFVENVLQDPAASLPLWQQAVNQTPEGVGSYDILQEHITELQQSLE